MSRPSSLRLRPLRHPAVKERRKPVKEPEHVAAPARPQFAELAEEPAYTPLPRDYASDFGKEAQGPAAPEERAASAGARALHRHRRRGRTGPGCAGFYAAFEVLNGGSKLASVVTSGDFRHSRIVVQPENRHYSEPKS